MITLSETPLIRAFNCDCMTYMAGLPDKAYGLAIVDPPYGIERMSRAGNDKHNRISLLKSGLWNTRPTKQYFQELFRISGNQIIWGANNFRLPASEYFCVWDKKQTVSNFASAEFAFVSMGLKKPAKIFRYSIHKHNQIEKINPCQKPVALYRWLLTNYAEPGQRIIDTHGGSLSSAIACWHEGYDMDICEIDKEYFDAACERFERETRQQKLFPASGEK